MPLAPGTQLGSYEILSPIESNGNAEVYRARKMGLEREVALTLLPPERGEVPELEQKLRALSGLNHPNILAVQDFGVEDGVSFLVTELIDGERLRAILRRGPVPVPRLFDIAVQMSGGLAAAHAVGIVHRDLRPENVIVIGEDGKSRVKIVNFELASQSPRAQDSNGTMPSSHPAALTRGPCYMSPEQLRGPHADNAPDHRSDIFSFGMILHEMVTGWPAFGGHTRADRISAIMEAQPAKLPAETNPMLALVVRRCLEKDPARRFQSAADLSFALQLCIPAHSFAERQTRLPADAPPITTTTPIIPAARKLRRPVWTGAALLAAAALLVGGLVTALPFVSAYFREPPKDARRVQFSVPPPRKITTIGLTANLSPDGSRLAFAGVDSSGKRMIWVQQLQSPASRPVSGTEGGTFPFWAADSRELAFFAGGKLKTVHLTSGAVRTLCEAPSGRPGSWNRNGVILFSPRSREGLYRITASGGAAIAVTALDRVEAETAHHFPAFLPDGEHFLFHVASLNPEHQGIYLGSLSGKSKKRISGGESAAEYVPVLGKGAGGYVLFLRGSDLMAQAFDLPRAQLTGEPFLVSGQVRVFPINRWGSVSQNGVLAYISSDNPPAQLFWADRNGKQLELVGPPGIYNNMRLSPDEKRVVIDRRESTHSKEDVWVLDLGWGSTSRLTFDPSVDNLPIWSPDGGRIVFPSNRTGAFDLYQSSARIAGNEQLLLKLQTPTGWATDWSRDGRFILFQMLDPKTGQHLWICPMSSRGSAAGQPFPFMKSEYNEWDGRFSPDGRWIAYVSDKSGSTEVYVQAFPTGGGERRKLQISTSGGTEPNWRSDGKELFYLAADGNLTAVPVNTGYSFEAGAPHPLFQIAANTGIYSYAPGGDGQRFLVSRSQAEATPVTVLVNWMAGAEAVIDVAADPAQK